MKICHGIYKCSKFGCDKKLSNKSPVNEDLKLHNKLKLKRFLIQLKQISNFSQSQKKVCICGVFFLKINTNKYKDNAIMMHLHSVSLPSNKNTR